MIVNASDIFRCRNPDEKIWEVKHWLKAKGVTDLESVSLSCDQLSKVCSFCRA